jgi:RNA polymerase sigma-70 factor (ECF subfamily)
MALRALGTLAAAEEAAQETLARAIVALQNGQPGDPEKIPAFVTGIARHVIADACRIRKRNLSLDALAETPPSSAADALSVLISNAERMAVRAALAQLSGSDRELLRLAFFEGLTPGDIAERLGEPVERIRKRKSRALERLRTMFLNVGQPGHETEE